MTLIDQMIDKISKNADAKSAIEALFKNLIFEFTDDFSLQFIY